MPMYPPPPSSLVLLSGGFGSATLLADLYGYNNTTEALTVHDGRRPAAVLQAAGALARHYGVRHHMVDFGAVKSLLRPPLIGHSETEDHLDHLDLPNDAEDRPPASPVWHSALYATAAAVADSRGLNQVAVGLHREDRAAGHTPEAFTAADLTVQLHTQGRVRLVAPYLDYTRGEVVTKGVHARLVGGMARACLTPAEDFRSPHCGRCAGCRHRRAAVTAAGVTDGVQYLTEPVA